MFQNHFNPCPGKWGRGVRVPLVLALCLLATPLLAAPLPAGMATGNSPSNPPPMVPPAAVPATNDNWVADVTNHLGQWIWDTNTFDKQTCRFWKTFDIPRGVRVTSAILDITVDNGYSLFLDGREIGRGSDWRTVTRYDVTRLLSPGRHILGVEAFNDRLEAGLIFGLRVELADQTTLDLVSDGSWFVVPHAAPNWVWQKTPLPDWYPVAVEGPVNHHPWEVWPFGLTTEPPLLPLIVHFWQTGWFELTGLIALFLAVSACLWLQTQLSVQWRSQKLLKAERIRIARDIHDGLGAQLTQLVLLGEVARREQPEPSPARDQFNQICALARELSHGMDEVVWVVNARRDTLRDFANYVCKYAQVFLDSTPIRCRLDVETDLPPEEFDLRLRRNLFLAVKEALNNAAKHSGATELFVRVHRAHGSLTVIVEDNGRGFDPEGQGGERNGMSNMAQRMTELGGACELFTAPGNGCRVVFTVPLERRTPPRWLAWLQRQPAADPGPAEIK
jgi:signal transduction histidine kinase